MKTSNLLKFLHAVFANLCIILAFAFGYFYFKKEFALSETTHKHINLLDCLFISTTIQAGVGIVNMMPTSPIGQWIMIIQQVCMIFAHIITAVYLFIL